jgi:hypothetical protein
MRMVLSSVLHVPRQKAPWREKVHSFYMNTTRVLLGRPMENIWYQVRQMDMLPYGVSKENCSSTQAPASVGRWEYETWWRDLLAIADDADRVALYRVPKVE